MIGESQERRVSMRGEYVAARERMVGEQEG
jgi:hypothetical protein